MFVDHWQLSRRLVLHVFHNVSSLSVVVCSHGHPNSGAAAPFSPRSAVRLCMSDSSSLLSLPRLWWSAFTGGLFPHSSPLSGPPSLPLLPLFRRASAIKGVLRGQREGSGGRTGRDRRLIDWGWLGKGLERWSWSGWEGDKLGKARLKGGGRDREEKWRSQNWQPFPKCQSPTLSLGSLWQTEGAGGERQQWRREERGAGIGCQWLKDWSSLWIL